MTPSKVLARSLLFALLGGAGLFLAWRALGRSEDWWTKSAVHEALTTSPSTTANTAETAEANRRAYRERALDHVAARAPLTFFVSTSGDDRNPGTSIDAAWRTTGRVNSESFAPGDSILFEGGGHFDGGLRFDRDDVGTPLRPVTVASFGRGRATLLAGDGHGLYVHNTGGFFIGRLVVVGSGWKRNSGAGVYFHNDLIGGVKIDHVRIDRLEASGFRKHGILVAGKGLRPPAGSGLSGYRDVRITNVSAHDNGLGGIDFRGDSLSPGPPYAHEDVYVGGAVAFRNSGLPGRRSHSGSGIVLSSVDGGVIEHSVAHDNGWLCDSRRGGPVGIWAWDANNVVIQFNESFRNRTGGRRDGGGFDLDGGVTNSVIQYNYSHDNDGAGFLLAQYRGARPFRDNTVRYNVSQNDGRRNGYAAIHVWAARRGVIEDTEVYNNTFFISPAADRESSALHIHEGATLRVGFRNNIFAVDGGLPVIRVGKDQRELVFQANAYKAGGSTVSVDWEGAQYASLAGWREATGQERIGVDDVGLSGYAGLQSAGSGRTLGVGTPLESLRAYRLSEASPLIDAGLDLKELFGIDPGPRDFFGTPLPQNGAFDIGAHEFPFSGSRETSSADSPRP